LHESKKEEKQVLTLDSKEKEGEGKNIYMSPADEEEAMRRLLAIRASR